jgi:hypothetical protein
MGTTAARLEHTHCAVRTAAAATAARWSRSITRAALLGSIALAAIALWTAVPAASLWIAGTLLLHFPGASAAVIPMTLALVVTGSFAVVRVLGVLSEAYQRRGTGPKDARVVEVVLVGSVLLAVAALAAWTFLHGCPSGRCVPGP